MRRHGVAARRQEQTGARSRHMGGAPCTSARARTGQRTGDAGAAPQPRNLPWRRRRRALRRRPQRGQGRALGQGNGRGTHLGHGIFRGAVAAEHFTGDCREGKDERAALVLLPRCLLRRRCGLLLALALHLLECALDVGELGGRGGRRGGIAGAVALCRLLHRPGLHSALRVISDTAGAPCRLLHRPHQRSTLDDGQCALP